ncbi:cytochrome P450 [Leptolyngbya sp. NIES-2104]|uniref:cytochrome P450 n=1 Tax=Leptolyngbya sp. NIES-2104 TaxID=1552121 RepID=UPI0006EC6744|nr:cytochrome P450 [Leptolyngbya sp. NIES-2104]GAP94291.1 cytochrome P450 [Leptolyngbya sp. NIES-2104]
MPLPNVLKTPPLFQKLQWILDPVRYMESAVQQYPDLFTADIVGFGDTFVFVQHPEAIQAILTQDHTKFFASGRDNTLLQPLVGDQSLFLLEGQNHRQQRQLLVPPFHGSRLQTYAQQICTLTQMQLSQLLPQQPFIARSLMQQLTLEIIIQVVFGLSHGDQYSQLKQLLTALMDLFRSPLTTSFLFIRSLQKDLGTWSPWGRFLQIRQQIDTLLFTEIAVRRAHPNLDRTDILSMLLLAQDETGQTMSDRALRDELMTLLLAGHETTASALTWGLYWIYKTPGVREKLQYELQSLGDAPNPLEIARLPYLSAVCSETLRITPVAMLTFPRVVQEPIELLGYPLDMGTIVMGCIYLLHQRPELYPNPKAFKPERFLDRQFSPYEFLAFGSGARRCVGDALAMLELKLVLATLVSQAEFELVDAQPELPRRRGVTLTPSRGVKMRLVS